MILMSKFRGMLAPEEQRPTVAVFGDSHTAALLRAQDIPATREKYEHVRIFRLQKEKSGAVIGDTDLAGFCRHIKTFTESDFVFSSAEINMQS